MNNFVPGDRVKTIVPLNPIPVGTEGKVLNVAPATLIVRFDGDTSPGRLTPKDAVRKI